MTAQIKRYISASIIVKAITAFFGFFSAQFNKSILIRRFLKRSDKRSGLSGEISNLLTKTDVFICEKLRLDKAFKNSILTKPIFWTGLASIFVPLLPTVASFPLAALVILSAILKKGIYPSSITQRNRPAAFIALYAATLAAAIVLSVDIKDALPGGATLVLFALTAVSVALSAENRRQAELCLAAMCFGGLLVAAFGIFQYFTGVNGASAWYDSSMFGSMIRVYSTLSNPNVLSEYLLIVIPFTAAKAILAKDDLRRLWWLGSLAVMIVCMALTFARGGWLGLILAVAVFLVMLNRKFILVGIIGIIALALVLPASITNRFLSIGNMSDGSTYYRTSIWLGTLAMIRDNILIGVGPGTDAFSRVYPLYAYSAAQAQHSHNLFLQLLCDGGIASFAPFLMFIGSLVRGLAGGTGKELVSRDARIYRIAAISFVFGFLLQGMTDYSFYNYRVTLVFWIAAGLAAALCSKTFDGKAFDDD